MAAFNSFSVAYQDGSDNLVSVHQRSVLVARSVSG
jgi:hypothetical protein